MNEDTLLPSGLTSTAVTVPSAVALRYYMLLAACGRVTSTNSWTERSM